MLFDRFANVPTGFLDRLAVREATRQGRTIRVIALVVGFLLDNNLERIKPYHNPPIALLQSVVLTPRPRSNAKVLAAAAACMRTNSDPAVGGPVKVRVSRRATTS